MRNQDWSYWLRKSKAERYTEKAKKRRLTPLKEGIFELDGSDWCRVRFERNTPGEVVKLITYYDDGRQDVPLREK